MRMILVAVLVLAFSAPASAQQLKLEFHDGRVTLDAAAVPVRTILSEWARLGGTKVVGAERIAGAPLTIHLENVPEAQALEVVLRNVAGYMAAPRSAASAVGASAYDRILVMPTSAAPLPRRPTPPAGWRQQRQQPRRVPSAVSGRRRAASRQPVEEPATPGRVRRWRERAARSRSRSRIPSRRIGQPGQPATNLVSPGRSARRFLRARRRRSSSSVPARPVRRSRSTRRRNSMPVLQFPAPAPAGNGQPPAGSASSVRPRPA